VLVVRRLPLRQRMGATLALRRRYNRLRMRPTILVPALPTLPDIRARIARLATGVPDGTSCEFLRKHERDRVPDGMARNVLRLNFVPL